MLQVHSSSADSIYQVNSCLLAFFDFVYSCQEISAEDRRKNHQKELAHQLNEDARVSDVLDFSFWRRLRDVRGYLRGTLDFTDCTVFTRSATQRILLNNVLLHVDSLSDRPREGGRQYYFLVSYVGERLR